MSREILTREILARSSSQSWELAVSEWELDCAYISDEPLGCLCGHHPIHEMVALRNKATGIVVELGNCCAKKFMQIGSDPILQSFKKIKMDPRKSLSPEAIDYAACRGWLAPWECALYRQTVRHKESSGPHFDKKIEFNQRFLLRMALEATERKI